MKRTHRIILMTLALIGNTFSLNAQAVNQNDSMVLVDLYNKTGGPQWKVRTNWLQGPVRNWARITLTSDRTRVRIVNLESNNLQGELPESLGNLTGCEFLDFQNNQLLRGAIPESLGNLFNLQTLYLQHNDFSGSIPESLSKLSKLESLFLFNNRLSGTVPGFLGSLPNLRNLRISHNKFTFDGLEQLELAQKQFTSLNYSLQDTMLPIQHNGDALYVSAGGTTSNNTYRWYLSNNSIDTIIVGNPNFVPKMVDNYRVEVTNSVAKDLTLLSVEDFSSVIAVLDPNPTMINSTGTVRTNLFSFDSRSNISSAVADGVTKLIVAINSRSAVTFTNEQDKAGTLSSLADQNTMGKQVKISPDQYGRAVAIYTVPDGYGFSNPAEGRSVTIKMSGIGGVKTDTSITISLFTPPVVLIHGMWSDPSIWYKGGFKEYLHSQGFNGIYLANYQQVNAVTFDPHSKASLPARTQLLSTILQALKDYRDRKIAVTQVDIVGHSLGALITRSLSQQPGFETTSNYRKGYIHKLISMGTPHRGSPIGPELYSKRALLTSLYNPVTKQPYTLPFSTFMELIKMPIGSCHKDFAINSQGVRNLARTLPYKTFSITANFYGGGNIAGELGGYLAMEAACRVIFDKSFGQVMQSRCAPNGELPSDLIVPHKSQTGYISATQLFLGTSHSIPGIVTETNNPLIHSRVAKLLLSDDPAEFSLGFPSPSSFPLEDCENATQLIDPTTSSPFQQGSTNTSAMIASGSTGYVKIAENLKGSIYRQNTDTTITIRYELFNGAVPTNALLMIQDAGWYSLSKTTPYTTTISLPRNLQTGNLNMILLVSDTTGIKMCDTTHISILPTGTATRTTVEPSFLFFDSFTREATVSLQQEYHTPGGTQINYINNGSQGVSYKTLHSQSVVKITDDGTVTAVNPGTDTLIVSTGDSTFKVAVEVSSDFLTRTMNTDDIDFTPVPNKTINDVPFALDATAISGENVQFELISGPAELNNGVVVIKGAGMVTIRATSQGNAYFNPAEPVTRSFLIGTALPLGLKGLEGSLRNKNVLLSWSTVSNSTASKFVIKRSLNGLQFTDIGSVDARASIQGTGKYNFTDTNVDTLNVPRIYYRVAELDHDGKQNLSNVISIQTDLRNGVTIYPNPARRIISISLNKLPGENSRMRMYDFSGRMVISQKLANQLTQKVNLPPTLRNGNYKLVIWSNGKLQHQQSIMVTD